MDPKTAQILLGAAGSGGAGEALYVDDVFSTYLYDGTNATKTVTNGIDFSGEGGLAWIKARNLGFNNYLFDTERGVQKYVRSDTTGAETTATNLLSSFNSDGFSLGNGSATNSDTGEFVSWNFRKAPGFFDVVTWTGNGSSGHAISHSLGSTPGAIFIKKTSATEGWYVFHRSAGTSKRLILDQQNAQESESNGVTAVSSSTFTLGTLGAVNDNNASYVAYVFAHDDQSFGTDGDEAIIKCDSYNGNGSSDGPTVSLGFEPQWLFIKRLNGSESWYILDAMRTMSSQKLITLRADMSAAEESGTNKGIELTADGFRINGLTSNDFNSTSSQYIYIAIRRSHKPPETATDVFDVQVLPSNSASNSTFISTGFDVDVCLDLEEAGDVYQKTNFMFRLLGNGKELDTQTTSAASGTTWEFDHSGGFKQGATNGTHAIASFRRAPGFLDIVLFEGDGSFGTRSHKLGVTPELVVQKSREFADEWNVITSGKIQYFNRTQAASNSSISNNHSSTVFGINTDNSSDSYVCLLFASLSGVSKVGTYSGTGNNIDVDCGFTAGARFVIIKRQDSTGDWYTFNSAHGIVSGNDPYKFLNEDGAATNTDYIDPLNAGFTITSSAPAELNTSGGTYLFLAIA